MVQIKTTTTQERSVDITLSNWRRMVSDPWPWFVLAVHLDSNSRPSRAYLVHIDDQWCARVLKRLRELTSKTVALHEHTMAATWSDDQQLAELHGRELRRLIQRHVSPNQHDYVVQKRAWYQTLGYNDRRRSVTVTFRASTEDEFYERLANIGAGITTSYTGEWMATLSDTRFGIKGGLQDFDRGSGEMEYHPPPQGPVVLQLSGDRELAVTCDLFRASAMFPFLPPKFDKARLRSRYVTCVVAPFETPAGHLGVSVQLEVDTPEERVSLVDAQQVADASLIITGQNKHPVGVRLLVEGRSWNVSHGPSHGPLPPREDALRARTEVLDRALAVCRAFGLADTEPLLLEQLWDQEWQATFMHMALTPTCGKLEAPYECSLKTGDVFGVVTACALHTCEKTLVMVAGAYGPVTECEERPGLGARVIVENGIIELDQVVLSSDADRKHFDVDAHRVAMADRLRGLGCIAVHIHDGAKKAPRRSAPKRGTERTRSTHHSTSGSEGASAAAPREPSEKRATRSKKVPSRRSSS
jgi:hypothetical protein